MQLSLTVSGPANCTPESGSLDWGRPQCGGTQQNVCSDEQALSPRSTEDGGKWNTPLRVDEQRTGRGPAVLTELFFQEGKHQK